MRFRVVDVASGAEHHVVARTPEDAARQVFSETLVRSAPHATAIVAKVYWDSEGQLTLVRLHRPKSDLPSLPG